MEEDTRYYDPYKWINTMMIIPIKICSKQAQEAKNRGKLINDVLDLWIQPAQAVLMLNNTP